MSGTPTRQASKLAVPPSDTLAPPLAVENVLFETETV